MDALGWDSADIILISGDSYIDTPYSGVALLGKWLMSNGFQTAIIAQPDVRNLQDISRLGEPNLFWGVSSGCVDSMVANYTALLKKRKTDDFTPGGLNNRRPDRAVLVYTNLIRNYSNQIHPKQTGKPVMLGGIEASLRRIAHYDYWSDKIRRSILLDAKADYLIYGMAEKSILEFARKLKHGEDPKNIKGLTYLSKQEPEGFIKLPPFEDAATDKTAFIQMFKTFYENNDAINGIGLTQRYKNRFLVQNPPSTPLTQSELDSLYSLDYEYAQHPYYERIGKVKALETIKFSIPTHRGCYGECNFCAISVHEGRTVQWRSEASILSEIKVLASKPDFKGYIHDLGGPTANMYGFECVKKSKTGSCKNKQCLLPEPCPALLVDHSKLIDVMTRSRKLEGIKKVFVASGIRYDLIHSDKKHGNGYMLELFTHHVSGQLKIAPEHSESKILKLMGKPGVNQLLDFKAKFDETARKMGKKQYLTYYFIAAHPGCTEQDMIKLKRFSSTKLKMSPDQVQVFTPTPSTYSSLMYFTEIDPFSGEKIFVEKDLKRKKRQKDILVGN